MDSYAFSTHVVEVSEDRQAQNIKCHDFRGFLTKASTLQNCLFIGVGAGPAGPVLAGPLFRQFNEIHYRYLCTRCYRRRSICCAPIIAGPLQKSFLHPCCCFQSVIRPYFIILCLFPGFQWQTFECDTLSLYHPLSYTLQNAHKCRFQQFQGPLNRWIV